VFESHRGGVVDIYTMNADGTNVVRLTKSADQDNSPAWSPDGTKIAFTSAMREWMHLVYTMNPDGTGLRQVTTMGANSSPSWSPDGSKIVYEETNSNFSGLVVVNSDGSGRFELTNGAEAQADDWSPDWSPDGSKIAFARSHFWPNNERGYLMTVDPDGTGLTQIASMYSVGDPEWSPDGSTIAFIGEEKRGDDLVSGIWFVSSNGGSPTLVKEGIGWGGVRDVTWSPDGSSLAYVALSPDGNLPYVIYRMNRDGSDVTVLQEDASSVDWGIAADPVASETRITSLRRSRTHVTIRGTLVPRHPGSEMTVTLFKKRNGRFVRVGKKTPSLQQASEYDEESVFTVSFKRPSAETCRVRASFGGDGDHLPSRARKTFSC